MNISSTFDRLHFEARKNIWLWLFSIFCRVSLAFGFFVAGVVKIMGERFASGLSGNHPMGHYLVALHETGYYYTFIGIAQVAAAIFLLIPRTVTLGAFIYFPIIFNITILTYATRFDGSIFTAPLMTLASLYLLGWNYEKWKYILPFNRPEKDFKSVDSGFSSGLENDMEDFSFLPAVAEGSFYQRFRVFLKQLFSTRFPTRFAAGVFAAVFLFVIIVPRLYSVKPRNTIDFCRKQFNGSNRTKAGDAFCNCIHTFGEPLDKCLADYNIAPIDSATTR